METDGCFHSSTVEQVTVNLDQANYFSGDSLKYRTSYVSSLWRGKRNEYAGSLKLKMLFLSISLLRNWPLTWEKARRDHERGKKNRRKRRKKNHQRNTKHHLMCLATQTHRHQPSLLGSSLMRPPLSPSDVNHDKSPVRSIHQPSLPFRCELCPQYIPAISLFPPQN